MIAEAVTAAEAVRLPVARQWHRGLRLGGAVGAALERDQGARPFGRWVAAGADGGEPVGNRGGWGPVVHAASGEVRGILNAISMRRSSFA